MANSRFPRFSCQHYSDKLLSLFRLLILMAFCSGYYTEIMKFRHPQIMLPNVSSHANTGRICRPVAMRPH
ncbi:hypothetical protein BC2230_40856 [Burkholderia cepacia]